MSLWATVGVTILHAIATGGCLSKGQIALGIVFAGFTLADIGMIIVLK